MNHLFIIKCFSLIEDFYNKVGSDYKLQDRTSQIGYANKAYVYEDSNIYFYYYEGKRSFDMGNIYLDEISNANGVLKDKKEEIQKGKDFSSIILYDAESYYRISNVGNTILFAKSKIDNKNIIDDVFDRCGY